MEGQVAVQQRAPRGVAGALLDRECLRAYAQLIADVAVLRKALRGRLLYRVALLLLEGKASPHMRGLQDYELSRFLGGCKTGLAVLQSAMKGQAAQRSHNGDIHM